MVCEFTHVIFSISAGWGISRFWCIPRAEMFVAPFMTIRTRLLLKWARPKFLNPAALPALLDLPEALNYPLKLKDETLSVSLVSMGNPHCVVPVDKLDLAQVYRFRPADRKPSTVPQTHECAIC